MYFLNIPLEIIIGCIIPYLNVPDILTLSVLSKDYYKVFSYNQLWRELYIRKKKKDFYKIEHNKIRKIVFSWNGLTPGLSNHRDPIWLFIKNVSDTAFSIVHVNRVGQWATKGKDYGFVPPYGLRIFRSYINHRWFITAKKNNRTNDVYKSKGLIIKESDISNVPMDILSPKTGKLRHYKDIVNIEVGEPYDKKSAKDTIDKCLPKYVRNYNNFKERTLKLNLPVVKKNKKKCVEILNYNHRIQRKELLQFERLKNKIEERGLIIEKEEKKLDRMNQYIKMLS